MVKKVLLMIVLLSLISAVGETRKSPGRSKTGERNVMVREATIRVSPNYMGPSAGKVSYGTKVNVIGEQGNWCQIESPSGWLPKSTLTKSKVKVNPDQKFAGGGAGHDEVALAGKGFNPQVESQYKKDNPQLRAAYAIVDKVETFGATESELKAFSETGKLH